MSLTKKSPYRTEQSILAPIIFVPYSIPNKQEESRLNIEEEGRGVQ